MRSPTASKAQNKNRFIKIITTPIRALGMAKDFYVRSMTNVGDKFIYGGGGGPTTMPGSVGQFSTGLPKSFSTRGPSRPHEGSDDFSELVRAASARSYGTRIDVDKILNDQLALKRSATTTTTSSMGPRQVPQQGVLPKCGSVAMGKIDEDAPCDFEEEGDVMKDVFPRSRSVAVQRRSVTFV